MTRAVLLMAYGSPETAEDVGPYFTHIRGGRPPSEDAVQRLAARYATVGGRTPLLAITQAVCQKLEQRLNASHGGAATRVFAGMKHWHPFIGDVVREMARAGVSEIVAIAMAPHFSRMSIGGYRTALDDAIAATGRDIAVRMVDHWHLHPAFVRLVANRIAGALAEWPQPAAGRVMTVFSAHSLPERIREWGDPYEAQLLDSCAAVAASAGLREWVFGWQSAGETGEPWIGPDIAEVLDRLHGDGVEAVISAPIGFVSDNLEILYDIDHVARAHAAGLGIELRRIPLPNATPEFVDTLADIVTDAVATAPLRSNHAP